MPEESGQHGTVRSSAALSRSKMAARVDRQRLEDGVGCSAQWMNQTV